jgi:hypothetical protein
MGARREALRTRQDDAAAVGRALAAAQVTVMITIFSVSSIVVIPWVYWCMAGMLVGYARMVHASARAERSAQPALRFA